MKTMKKKILIVDDEKSIRKLVQRHLKKMDCEVLEAKSGEEALKIVETENERLNLILLDVMMPGIDGFEVCKKIRENHKLSSVYIIMLTAKTESKSKVKGLEIGADDYITKPFHPEELQARIRTGLRTAEEKKGAIKDALTQLYNRHFLNRCISLEVVRAKRYKRPLSMVMVDLDYFKRVNDTFGHDAGDVVLVELAEILKDHCRKTDLPVRWGGEEFVLLLPETDMKGAGKLADKIRVTVKEHEFAKAGFLTVSLGVAVLTGSKEDLLKRVDQALYQAKGNGRDQVKVV